MASEQALSNQATGWIEARYHQPFLAHACMEPMTATVSVEADRVLVYAPTQSPKRSAEQVAAHLGRPVADIKMFNTYLGGGFGRKGLDFGATFHAATLSAQIGRPVQVIWDRETDIEQDQFRPAAAYWCRRGWMRPACRPIWNCGSLPSLSENSYSRSFIIRRLLRSRPLRSL